VLDGGQDEVFLGGTRLTHFMESVEKATGAIPWVEVTETAAPGAEIDEIEKVLGAEGVAGAAPGPEGIPATPAPPPAKDPWAELATAGLAFLDKLGEALSAGAGNARTSGPGGEAGAPGGIPPVLIERDEAGRSYLKLPAPNPDTLKKLADVLYRLSGR
jgi:hypothetical protein